MLAGTMIGAAGISVLHAQAKPPVYLVTEIDVTNPDDSLLLREPAKGGLPHAQVKLFSSTDTDYQTIKSWLGGAKLGSTCNTGAN